MMMNKKLGLNSLMWDSLMLTPITNDMGSDCDPVLFAALCLVTTPSSSMSLDFLTTFESQNCVAPLV